MSLAINITTPDGIVLASDSRQTYINRKGQARIGSESATKLFKITPMVGIASVGPAFLMEDGILKNIAYFMDRFVKEEVKESMSLPAEVVAEKVYSYFGKLFEWKKELDKAEFQLREQAGKLGGTDISVKREHAAVILSYKLRGETKTMIASINPLQFFVAGYNPDGSHEVFIVSIPGGVDKKRDSTQRGMEFGASWIGQGDVITRIVLGFDPRIGGLPFLTRAAELGSSQEVGKQLRQLEYSIQWGTMTLQDGIDFARLMIETTAAIQRFSDGIIADPGDIPGVGGTVDVVIISPKKGFIWVSKKGLKVENRIIDLDEFDNLDIKRTNKAGVGERATKVKK